MGAKDDILNDRRRRKKGESAATVSQRTERNERASQPEPNVETKNVMLDEVVVTAPNKQKNNGLDLGVVETRPNQGGKIAKEATPVVSMPTANKEGTMGVSEDARPKDTRPEEAKKVQARRNPFEGFGEGLAQVASVLDFNRDARNARAYERANDRLANREHRAAVRRQKDEARDDARDVRQAERQAVRQARAEDRAEAVAERKAVRQNRIDERAAADAMRQAEAEERKAASSARRQENERLREEARMLRSEQAEARRTERAENRIAARNERADERLARQERRSTERDARLADKEARREERQAERDSRKQERADRYTDRQRERMFDDVFGEELENGKNKKPKSAVHKDVPVIDSTLEEEEALPKPALKDLKTAGIPRGGQTEAYKNKIDEDVPMYVPTPERAKRAQEYARNLKMAGIDVDEDAKKAPALADKIEAIPSSLSEWDSVLPEVVVDGKRTKQPTKEEEPLPVPEKKASADKAATPSQRTEQGSTGIDPSQWQVAPKDGESGTVRTDRAKATVEKNGDTEKTEQVASIPQANSVGSMMDLVDEYAKRMEPTKEQLEKERRRRKAAAVLAAIGDGVSAWANLQAAVGGAPSAKQTSLSSIMQERYEKLRKEREEKAKEIMAYRMRAHESDRQQANADRNFEEGVRRYDTNRQDNLALREQQQKNWETTRQDGIDQRNQAQENWQKKFDADEAHRKAQTKIQEKNAETASKRAEAYAEQQAARQASMLRGKKIGFSDGDKNEVAIYENVWNGSKQNVYNAILEDGIKPDFFEESEMNTPAKVDEWIKKNWTKSPKARAIMLKLSEIDPAEVLSQVADGNEGAETESLGWGINNEEETDW